MHNTYIQKAVSKLKLQMQSFIPLFLSFAKAIYFPYLSTVLF